MRGRARRIARPRSSWPCPLDPRRRSNRFSGERFRACELIKTGTGAASTSWRCGRHAPSSAAVRRRGRRAGGGDRAWRRRATCHGAPRPWIRAIARNEALRVVDRRRDEAPLDEAAGLAAMRRRDDSATCARPSGARPRRPRAAAAALLGRPHAAGGRAGDVAAGGHGEGPPPPCPPAVACGAGLAALVALRSGARRHLRTGRWGRCGGRRLGRRWRRRLAGWGLRFARHGAPSRSSSVQAPIACVDMTDFEEIRAQAADGVLTITLNRPERLNAFTETMARELIAAFDRADADDDVRAVIVTGEGRGFCAGADLARGRRRRSTGASARPPMAGTCRATAAARSRCGSSTARSR